METMGTPDIPGAPGKGAILGSFRGPLGEKPRNGGSLGYRHREVLYCVCFAPATLWLQVDCVAQSAEEDKKKMPSLLWLDLHRDLNASNNLADGGLQNIPLGFPKR